MLLEGKYFKIRRKSKALEDLLTPQITAHYYKKECHSAMLTLRTGKAWLPTPQNNKTLEDLNNRKYKEASELFDSDIYDTIKLRYKI